MKHPTPIAARFDTPEALLKEKANDQFRLIEAKGASGLVARSIRSTLRLDDLPLNSSLGSCVFWAMPLETLATCVQRPSYSEHLNDPDVYPILHDSASRDEIETGKFKFIWDAGWHPQMYFRMEEGMMMKPIDGRWTQSVALTNHFSLKALHWYCFTLVWDRQKDRYAIYANGIRIAKNNHFPDPSGVIPGPLFNIKTLYAGSPSLALRDFAFYDRSLEESEIRAISEDSPLLDRIEQQRLRSVYEGRSLTPFSFTPDSAWQKRWYLSLQEPKHMENFYAQGNTKAADITEDGLLIETPFIDQPMRYRKDDDLNQIYLWTRERFEGNLYLKFQFKPMRHGGLSLLCLQSSGMQREDFMADYPLRTTGSMRMVHLEDVRNYHWEFFREMNDTRNDLASHALLKNPWLRPLAFACQASLIELHKWHTLEFVQEGARLRGAIDGQTIFDATDSAENNNGPILDSGRIALRCMIRSKILYRRLEVWNQAKFREL